MRLLLVLIIMATIAVSGCGKGYEDYGRAVVTVNGNAFDVEVPLKGDGFLLGLMHRTELADDKGMLFAYQKAAQRSFWMKNTLIPLDIIFIDESMEIKTIHHAVPCEADPCRLYPSTVPAQYVLEIRGNLSTELEIKEGDRVKIDYK